ncbi:MAG: hypothetical protein GW850_09215 [Sphingomonadales bacterium]|nr:hypothetical protein [Sphingomonadales bacterium]NCP49364.1 hypothetical protein [Sphingomonadales bacterium]
MAMPNLVERQRQALDGFAALSKLSTQNLDLANISSEILKAPHEPAQFPKGNMAIYSFWKNYTCLKVGIASPNNNARFVSHHYGLNRAPSNLAKSIDKDPTVVGLLAPPEDYSMWIRQNCSRINFWMPGSWGKSILSLFEAYLHVVWTPIYEGGAWKT